MSTAITRRSGANMRRERAAALRACRAYCGSGAGGHPVDHDEPPDPIEAGDSLTKLEWQASQCGFADSAFDVLEQQQELKARAEVAGFDDVQDYLDFLEQATCIKKSKNLRGRLIAQFEARLFR